jgi:epoxide hydrolase-like predicted phosphatase
MTIKAVAFDIGGVLEVTPPTGIDEEWERRLGLEPGELAARLDGVFEPAAVGAVTEAELHRQVGEALGVGQDRVGELMAGLWEEYLGTLNAEMFEFAAGLRPAYRTGIISNSSVGAREREQERYRMAELTDVLIYSHEVGITKPDPRIYRLAWQRLGVRPTEMIFLDDVTENVAAARDLGIHAILFSSTAQAIADIRAGLESLTP